MFFKNTPCIVQNFHHNNRQVFVTFLDNSGNELLQWHKMYYMYFQSVTIFNHFWFFFTFKGYVDSILPNIFNVLIQKILTVKVSQQQKFKSLGHYYWEPSKLMTRKWLTTIVILVSCTFKTHFLYNCWVSIPCRKEEIHRLEAEKICFLALELENRLFSNSRSGKQPVFPL